MSDRGYFSIRDAIPGYTLIMIVIGINFYPLYRISLDYEVWAFGTAFGLVSLLGGSAIGFLVCQMWWAIFHLSNLHYRWKPIGRLVEKYGLSKERKREVVAVYGYVVHFEGARKKVEKNFAYTTRRWDLYHLLCSLIVAVALGCIVGFVMRSAYFPQFFEIPANPKETPIWTMILVSLFFLVGSICVGIRSITLEYENTSEAIIRNSKLGRWDLAKVFPLRYFDSSIDRRDVQKLEKAGVCSILELANSNSDELVSRVAKLKEDVTRDEVLEWISNAREFLRQG